MINRSISRLLYTVIVLLAHVGTIPVLGAAKQQAHTRILSHELYKSPEAALRHARFCLELAYAHKETPEIFWRFHTFGRTCLGNVTSNFSDPQTARWAMFYLEKLKSREIASACVELENTFKEIGDYKRRNGAVS